MKNSAIAVIMIAALLMSACASRGVVNNREPNFIVIIDKEFLKKRVEYRWRWWDETNGKGSGRGFNPMGVCIYLDVVIVAVVVTVGIVYIIPRLIIHNARGTNVSLTVLYEDRSSETFELNWGINRFYLTEEHFSALEENNAWVTLTAEGTRNLAMGVPTGIMRTKKAVHTLEFASDGKILADGIVVDSPHTQTEPQPGSGEDLLKRTQEPERYDNGSHN